MRGALAGLIVAFIIVVVALLIATLAAVGVAAIGLLLSRWFDLTQWQGSLIALATSLSIGFGIYRLAAPGEVYSQPDWIELDEQDEEVEPPIVAWRRQRPTQGDLSSGRTKQRGPRPK